MIDFDAIQGPPRTLWAVRKLKKSLIAEGKPLCQKTEVSFYQRRLYSSLIVEVIYSTVDLR